MSSLCESLGKINVEELRLDLGGYSQAKNKLKNDGASAVAELLSNLKGLRKLALDLSHNGIKAEGAKALAKALRNGRLEELELLLNNNDLDSKAVGSLAKGLCQLCLRKVIKHAIDQNCIKS